MRLHVKQSPMKAFFCLMLALVICGCAGLKKDNKSAKKSISIVGLWKQYGPPVYPVSSITLRNEDGTFMTKWMKIYDYAKPEIEYSSTGLWKVTGNQYWEKLTSITAPMWQGEVGSELKLEILEISDNIFKYISSDGATVMERKIGGASLEEFEAAKVKPLPKKTGL